MKQKRMMTVMAVVILYLISLMAFYMVNGEPEGASITLVSNTTKNATAATSRQDPKGTITTLLLNTVQQNIKWKAYIGNVSGTLVLRDADSYSIYEWSDVGSPDGEVYMTRNSTVDWDTIQCANETDVISEQTALGHVATASDNINATFSNTAHEQFLVGDISIVNSTCKSVATWVNNTAQTVTESSLYQEVILMDSSLRIIYTALIDQDTKGYRNDTTNTTYDFQAIVPDSTGVDIATYYFYVEIDG